jgi:hypothetical protein
MPAQLWSRKIKVVGAIYALVLIWIDNVFVAKVKHHAIGGLRGGRR